VEINLASGPKIGGYYKVLRLLVKVDFNKIVEPLRQVPHRCWFPHLPSTSDEQRLSWRWSLPVEQCLVYFSFYVPGLFDNL